MIITCSGCEKKLDVSGVEGGKKVRCKNCENILTVPDEGPGSDRQTRDKKTQTSGKKRRSSGKQKQKKTKKSGRQTSPRDSRGTSKSRSNNPSSSRRGRTSSSTSSRTRGNRGSGSSRGRSGRSRQSRSEGSNSSSRRGRARTSSGGDSLLGNKKILFGGGIGLVVLVAGALFMLLGGEEKPPAMAELEPAEWEEHYEDEEIENHLDQLEEEMDVSDPESMDRYLNAALAYGRDQDATDYVLEGLYRSLMDSSINVEEAARAAGLYREEALGTPRAGENLPDSKIEIGSIPENEFLPGSDRFLAMRNWLNNLQSQLGEQFVSTRVETFIEDKSNREAGGDARGHWALAQMAHITGNKERANELAENAFHYNSDLLAPGLYTGRAYVGEQWKQRDAFENEIQSYNETWELEYQIQQNYDEQFYEWRRRAEEHIQEHSEQYGRPTVQDTSVPPWVFYMEEREHSAGDRVLNRFVTEMEKFKRDFMRSYSQHVVGNVFQDYILPIYIFRDGPDGSSARDRYQEEKDVPPVAGGHFVPNPDEPDAGWAFTAYTGMADVQSTVYHESVHQLVWFIGKNHRGGQAPANTFWFQEGLATYFEIGTRIDNEWQFGEFSTEKYGPRLRRAFERNITVDFETIFGTSYTEFRSMVQNGQADMGNWYSHAWSILYFFHNYEGGKYAENFASYMELELTGEAGEDPMGSFRQYFDTDLDQMESEWQEFMQKEFEEHL